MRFNWANSSIRVVEGKHATHIIMSERRHKDVVFRFEVYIRADELRNVSIPKITAWISAISIVFQSINIPESGITKWATDSGL